MPDENNLQKKIKEKGILKSKILENLGISYPTLRERMNNVNSFRADEIQKLCEMLDINTPEEREKIFFNNM